MDSKIRTAACNNLFEDEPFLAGRSRRNVYFCGFVVVSGNHKLYIWKSHKTDKTPLSMCTLQTFRVRTRIKRFGDTADDSVVSWCKPAAAAAE
eukprot:574152-Amphidinium_carterae.1